MVTFNLVLKVSCTISSGDMPIEIEWKKDGETFDPPTDIQVNPLPHSGPASIVLPTDSIVLRALRPLGIALSSATRCRITCSAATSSSSHCEPLTAVLNLKIYLSKYVKCICPNYQMYFSKFENIGSYTCRATNKAAAVNFTAQLIVRGEMLSLFIFSCISLYLLSRRRVLRWLFPQFLQSGSSSLRI